MSRMAAEHPGLISRLTRHSVHPSRAGEATQPTPIKAPKQPKTSRRKTSRAFLRKLWRSKAKDEYHRERIEKKRKKSLQEVLSTPYHQKELLDCLYAMLSSQDNPCGKVVAEVSRDIINCFEVGDKEKILAESKEKLDLLAHSIPTTSFLAYRSVLAKLTPEEFTALCRDAVFQVFLSREPNVILDHYHAKFATKDLELCNLFAKISSEAHPIHFEIPQKFWLISKNMPPPYSAAIAALQKFPLRQSPMHKVEALRETAHKICEAVDHFWNVHRSDFPNGDEPTIAADDLVSIFCYVMVKAKVQLLFSEGEYLGDYIGDNNLVGETGYLITTLQCCCHVLCEFDADIVLRPDGDSPS